ncbi:NAD(P)/FAD-dependent oxidoreductase [Oleomonas cavernae]|uniref:NAD(P)/FAD-dependent oxidoreductase n=1 Tax=Oleomonas cavernae TaxID=2320859 RepID=UPI001F45F24A|nr:NAD(P)/FAD-dependent oxidoreductase [Oleomonas cavernae]
MTDHIERFTEDGILLQSGETLEADIIVTATGLQMQVLGGTKISLDGTSVNLSKKLYYKGAMVEDVPNFATVFGYTNSSWTLKADLIAEYFCRVINHMEQHGYAQCTPRNYDGRLETQPILDLKSGYVQRALAQLPSQGNKAPWKMYQNYLRDRKVLKKGTVDDKVLIFNNPISHTYNYPESQDLAALVRAAGAQH